MRALSALLLLAILAGGCDSTQDPPTPTPTPTPAAPPVVDSVFPAVVVPGSYVYLQGSGFGTDVAGVTVRFQPAEGTAVTGQVVETTDTQLTVQAPADLPTTGAPLTISVETAAGSAAPAGQPVYGIASSAFGDVFEPGRGLVGRVYPLAAGTPQLPDFDTLTPASLILAPTLNVAPRSFTDGFPGVPGGLVEWFGIRFDARLDVPAAGTYTLRANSDDGSKIYVDGALVIDNDGLHGPRSVSGSVDLSAGLHDLRVDYFQGPRTVIALQLYWTPPGAAEAIIPTAMLRLPDPSVFLPPAP